MHLLLAFSLSLPPCLVPFPGPRGVTRGTGTKTHLGPPWSCCFCFLSDPPHFWLFVFSLDPGNNRTTLSFAIQWLPTRRWMIAKKNGQPTNFLYCIGTRKSVISSSSVDILKIFRESTYSLDIYTVPSRSFSQRRQTACSTRRESEAAGRITASFLGRSINWGEGVDTNKCRTF